MPLFAFSMASLHPAPGRAAEIEVVLPLADLLLLRASVAEVDSFLFTPILGVAPYAGIKAQNGDVARTRVKTLLRDYKPRELGREAAEAASQASVLSRRAAENVEGHAREVRAPLL